MSGERSLRDLLLESADDLEFIVKQIIDSLLNRDKNPILRGGESVTNLVRMFDVKQDEIRKFLKRVPEFQERQLLIKDLTSCVASRDKLIQELELNLKACEVALNTAVFQASQKLKSVREAEMRAVNSERIIKLAHQISRNYSVSAPLTWQQGDPSRPFPQEHEFRNGLMGNLKNQTTTTSVPVGAIRNINSSIRTPPIPGKTTGSPLLNQNQNNTNMWSPRTGFAGPNPMPNNSNRVTPTQHGQPWPSGQTTPNISPFHKGAPSAQSPLVSPRINLKITGLPARIPPPPVRNVEQMSSDSSSSSSSEDEGPK